MLSPRTYGPRAGDVAADAAPAAAASRRTRARSAAAAGRAGTTTSRTLIGAPAFAPTRTTIDGGGTRSSGRRPELGERRLPAGAPRVGERLRREDDAVTEDRQEEMLDVDGRDVRAIVEQRPRRGPPARARGCRGRRPRPPPRASRASRARARRSSARAADRDRRRAPRPATQLDLVDGDDRRGASASGWCSRWSSMISSSSSSDGIAERRLQEEAVELRLGQRERALVLDRVLRREEQERARQRPGQPVGRHLLLGHRLEQRGLRLRHRAVDLVDEHDVREDRPRLELELADLLVVDREAR